MFPNSRQIVYYMLYCYQVKLIEGKMRTENPQILFRVNNPEEKRDLKAYVAKLGYSIQDYFLELYQIERKQKLIKPKS